MSLLFSLVFRDLPLANSLPRCLYLPRLYHNVCHTISSIGKRAIVQWPCGTPCCCLRYQFKSKLLSFSPNSLIRHLQEQRVMGQRLGPLLPPATPEHSSALLALSWTSPSSWGLLSAPTPPLLCLSKRKTKLWFFWKMTLPNSESSKDSFKKLFWGRKWKQIRGEPVTSGKRKF